MSKEGTALMIKLTIRLMIKKNQLRSQSVTSNGKSETKILKNRRGERRYLSFTFAEQGVLRSGNLL